MWASAGPPDDCRPGFGNQRRGRPLSAALGFMKISVSHRARLELLVVAVVSGALFALSLFEIGRGFFVLYAIQYLVAVTLVGGVHGASWWAADIAFFLAIFVTNYLLWLVAKFAFVRFKGLGHET